MSAVEWEELTTAMPGFGVRGDLWVADTRDVGMGDLLSGVLQSTSTSIRAVKRHVEHCYAEVPGRKRWRRDDDSWVYEVAVPAGGEQA